MKTNREMHKQASFLSWDKLAFGLLFCWLAVFSVPFAKVLRFSFHSEVYTHIMLIPFVACYLIWVNRKKVSFKPFGPWPTSATALVCLGLVSYLFGFFYLGQFDQEADRLFLQILPGLILFWGLFLGLFGVSTFKAFLFPLLFLAAMVPLPSLVLDSMIKFLQTASAGTAEVVFRVLHIPFLRDGNVFALPGMAIEVAPECSGIRSTMALTVLGLVAAYLFLNTNRRRLAFMAVVLPVSIFKNALRIAMLGYLGAFVDKGFVTDSWLHQQGGRPFIFMAALVLLPVLWGLRVNEKRSRAIREAGGGPALNAQDSRSAA